MVNQDKRSQDNESQLYVFIEKWDTKSHLRIITKFSSQTSFLFVLRFYGPVKPMGSCCVRSVYLATCLLGRLSPLKRLTSIVHILSPETDNCPSWISGRERMTVENISWSISTKKCCRPRRGLNLRPPPNKSSESDLGRTVRRIWQFLY